MPTTGPKQRRQPAPTGPAKQQIACDSVNEWARGAVYLAGRPPRQPASVEDSIDGQFRGGDMMPTTGRGRAALEQARTPRPRTTC